MYKTIKIFILFTKKEASIKKNTIVDYKVQDDKLISLKILSKNCIITFSKN